jgi:hypothetical protein
MRPTNTLRAAQAHARPADAALDPAELGTARSTRHSFARSFLRAAARERWQVTRTQFDVDASGRGDVVYIVDASGHRFSFVAFSTKIAEAQRTDRVIADAWDVTAALIEGDVSTDRLEDLRANVTAQEGGRADAGTLVWTRANRSARFFDYVVEQLAAGEQPEPAAVGDAAYVLRSTAFYANGKWGLADFERYSTDHPLALPYRAQMLAAWLLRELSYDLVEHCARQRSNRAAALDAQWRRFFGLGNATGLGMVPYVINHPQVLDAWVALRELPLAHALAQQSRPRSAHSARLVELLQRAVHHFAERDTLATAPYPTGPELAAGLAAMLALAGEYNATGTVGGESVSEIGRALHEAGAKAGAEVRQVIDTVLVECHEELDADVEHLLRCDEHPDPTLAQTAGMLLERLKTDYGWVHQLDLDADGSRHYFWYFSQNSQEPRRGVRGRDHGEHVEQPLAMAFAVRHLMSDLATAHPDITLGEFLLAYPWHRGTIARVQGLAGVPYGEARVNPISAEFLPLDLQRFQLATYGMENFSPMSTDWLRVTLLGGAPRATDVAAGLDDDWLFTRKPGGNSA